MFKKIAVLPFIFLIACTSNVENSLIEKDKPNIILVVADDHGMNDLGCYGNSFISTPNLDSLAKEGVRFTRSYATAPSCTASRSVILPDSIITLMGFMDMNTDIISLELIHF